MKNRFAFLTLLLLFLPLSLFSQRAFDDGEWFKFRVHYGFLNAGYASMEVSQMNFDNKEIFHVVGKGWSTGAVHAFFKVRDNYETYIDKTTGLPYRFIRQIDEGGHTRDIQVDFDHNRNKALVINRKHNETNTYSVPDNVQDMLSAFYYFRNHLNGKPLVPGQEYKLKMFYGDETQDFKLKFLGREVIKTKFGKIATLKFRPYVLAGRVFEEKESLTFWVTDDLNKMPLKIKANLAVGSLDADIDAFKGLKHPIMFIMD